LPKIDENSFENIPFDKNKAKYLIRVLNGASEHLHKEIYFKMWY